MPPHIQPQSLEVIVLSQVADLIIKSCDNIQWTFGCYEKYPCQRAASDLQNYLLPKVKPFLDRICEKVGHADLCQLNDKRIFYAVIVHSATKVLNLNALLTRHSLDYTCYNMFCIDKISRLSNLVSLDICQKNISDEVLKTIADTCYKSLESMTITPLLTEFIDGLAYLSKCKELRHLKILSITLTLETLPSQSLESLRLLITALPKLEFFDSADMVKILSGVNVNYPLLSLRRVKEIEADSCSVSHVIKICPNLEYIDIAVDSGQEALDVLSALVNSSLKLKSLKLRGFTCQSQLDSLFTMKGVSLVHINLDNRFSPVTYKNIFIIGKYCPNLQSLGLDISDSFPRDEDLEIDTKLPKATSPMFSELKSLCFGWYRVESRGQTILPLILCGANKLSDLMLQCSTSSHYQDALDAVLCLSPLVALSELSVVVNGPGAISQQSMSCLISCCQKLRGCYIYGRIRKGTRVFLQELYGRIRDENLDLQIDVFER